MSVRSKVSANKRTRTGSLEFIFHEQFLFRIHRIPRGSRRIEGVQADQQATGNVTPIQRQTSYPLSESPNIFRFFQKVSHVPLPLNPIWRNTPFSFLRQNVLTRIRPALISCQARDKSKPAERSGRKAMGPRRWDRQAAERDHCCRSFPDFRPGHAPTR